MSLNTFLNNLQAVQLANGDVKNITPVFMSAGIAAEYKSFRPSDVAAAKTTDTILILAAERFRAMAQAIPDATKRADTCLVLTMARVSSYMAWEVADADLIASQVENFLAPLTDAFVASCIADNKAAAWSSHGTRQEIHVAYQAINQRFTHDPHYPAFLAKVARAAIGCFVTTGVTLCKTMIHHFVEPHKAYSRAILKEIFGRKYAADSYYSLSSGELEDLVCHKANHCIVSAKMMDAARAQATVDKMTAFGLASSVVRVPARTDIEASYSAVARLVSSCAPMLRTSGVVIGADALAIEAEMKELSRESAAAGSISDLNAIERKYRAKLEVHAGSVAWVLGFYKATLADSPNPKETLSKAKYLARLTSECHTQAVSGTTHYRDYRKWVRNRLDGNEPPAAKLFGA